MSSFKKILSSLVLSSVLLNSSVQADSNRADYVIVGVGTAGAVVAKRLTDDKTTSVIALQRGENLNKSYLIHYSRNALFTVFSGLLGNLPNTLASNLPPNLQPEFSAFLGLLPPPTDPLYIAGQTTPQVFADARQFLWLLALPSGGASSINAGAWCRGTNQVYSQWEAIAGPEWSVNRILATYKQLEKYKGQTTNPDSRGYHGLLKIRQAATTPLSSKFTEAIIAATGFPFVLDYNDPKTPIGVSSQIQLSQHGHDGKYRLSSAMAFLSKDVMKPNGRGVDGRKLRVLFGSTALRTIWEGNKAVGVEYLQNGETKQVFANKGVIVCAGVYSSAFLMHSGVGPAAVIAPLGIPVIFDNPNVGEALADQPHVVTLFTSNPADTVPIYKTNTLFSEIAWLPSPSSDPTVREIRISTVNPIPGVTAALVDLCQPRSRGSIVITSANPLDPPTIDIGELSNSTDLDLYREAFQVYVKNINIALQAIDPLYQLVFPNPAILDDPVLVDQFIREEIEGNQHYQCHCRMAPLVDGGVVDSSGHVYGVQNLIVADDSIVPVNMDGSPMATAYLIGANVARILLGQ